MALMTGALHHTALYFHWLYYSVLLCLLVFRMCCTADAQTKGLHLTASVVNGKMGDGGSMAGHLPHLSVGVALPQQDIPLQAPTSTQAEGLAVGKAVYPSAVCCHSVQHLAPGEVCDLDCAVQGTGDQAQLMDVGHLQDEH